MTIYYVDLAAGNDGNNGLSFANRKKTLASVATAGAAAGDTIRVMGKPSTNAGINATFTNLSGTVTLASALTQSLYTSGAAWTAATNVTCTGSKVGKLTSTSASDIAIAAAFTTGKAAHFATGSLNLSGYQQLSFWIKPSIAVAAGVLRFDLCSDTTGNTIVDSLTLPALSSAVWNCVTVNKGSAFGASIQSIRLHCISDPGTVTITVDDIIACKAASNVDALTLNSLVSSDGATWYGIKTINGTAVRLDTGGPGSAQSSVGIWSGTTGSVALLLQQPIAGTNGAPLPQTFNNAASGTAGSPITISGGWDTTAMTTQNGLTVIDANANDATAGLVIGCNYVTLDKLAFARFNTALNLNGSTKQGYTLSNFTITDGGGLFTLPSRGMTFNVVKIINSIGGLSLPVTTNYSTDGVNYDVGFVTIIGNTSGDGITVPANIGSPAPKVHDCAVIGTTTGTNNGFNIQSPCIFYNNTANDQSSGSAGVGFNFQNVNGLQVYNLQGRNNSGADIQLNNASVEIFTLDTNFNLGTQVKFVTGSEGQAVIYNWTPNATATKVALGDPATGETAGNVVYSQKEGGVAGNNNIYTDYGTITSNGIVGQSGTGIAWQMSPNAFALAGSPLRLNVGKVACPANVTTQITYWAKLSAAGPTALLRVFGGRYAGVGSPGTDVTVSISGTSYAQYTISVLPTENCVIDVYAEIYGSSTQSLTVSGPAIISQ